MTNILIPLRGRCTMATRASLFIDGAKVASSDTLVARGKAPLLIGHIGQGEGEHRVEGFLKSDWRKLYGKIMVDGERIAGDDF